MEGVGWTVTETASRLGCERGTLSRLLNGKAGVSANMALEDIGWGTDRQRGRSMEKTGRKNAAGDWLRGRLFSRAASVGMLSMALAGFGLGFMVRGFAVFDGWPEILTALVTLGLMVVGLSALYLYCRHLDATWGGATGCGASGRRSDRTRRGTARLRIRARRQGSAGRAGQRRSCGDDTGGHLGGGNQSVLAEQAEVSRGVAPGGQECAPGSPPISARLFPFAVRLLSRTAPRTRWNWITTGTGSLSRSSVRTVLESAA